MKQYFPNWRLTLVVIMMIGLPRLMLAQSVKASLGVSGGAGEMYLIERIELGAVTEYKPTFGMGVDFELAFEEAYFDLAFSYLYLSTRYRSSWVNNPFANYLPINYNSFFFSLSHVTSEGRIRLGYQFGFGFSREVDEGRGAFFTGPHAELFPSAQVSGIARIPLSERIDLNLRPMLIWSDVIGTFRYNEWNLRGEDAHFFTQVGLRYNFVK